MRRTNLSSCVSGRGKVGLDGFAGHTPTRDTLGGVGVVGLKCVGRGVEATDVRCDGSSRWQGDAELDVLVLAVAEGDALRALIGDNVIVNACGLGRVGQGRGEFGARRDRTR